MFESLMNESLAIIEIWIFGHLGLYRSLINRANKEENDFLFESFANDLVTAKIWIIENSKLNSSRTTELEEKFGFAVLWN